MIKRIKNWLKRFTIIKPIATNYYKRWTKDELDECYEMLREGLNEEIIAYSLGRTVNSIKCQKHKLIASNKNKYIDNRKII